MSAGSTNQKGKRNMTSKEQFALVLRVLGVLGLMYLVRQTVRNPMPEAYVLAIRIVCVPIGLYMIRGAGCLMKFAYPECPETAGKAGA
jgi:hypothetical protein